MPEQRTLRVAAIQTHATPDPEDNVRRNLALGEQAVKDGAELICFQELFRSPYFCQVEDESGFALAEAIPGPTSERVAAFAKAHGVTVVASLFERRAAGLYHNTAAVLNPNGEHDGIYRKMHIPDDPRFYEKYYFTPGDLGFRTFGLKQAQLGVLICWDQWYPEAARMTALKGAEVLCYPTAIGTWSGELELKEAQHQAWQTIQRSHAIANGVFVVAVNRIGIEDELHFWGRSFIAGPDGGILAEAGEEEAILIADLDLSRIEGQRQGWPFLRDRRIDAYEPLTRRWLGDAR